MAFFIHNRYDKRSIEQLATLPEGTIVIDLFQMRQDGDMTYGDLDKLAVSEIPCMMEELKFIEDELQPEVKQEPEPTFEERMESKADYIMMMQGEGGKDYA